MGINLQTYKKQIEFDGKTWNIDVVIDSGCHVGHIVEEPGIIFQAIDEADVYNKAMSGLQMWKKHMSVWGVKNMKTKQFSFKPFGSTLRITLFTPYASKSWLWMWHRSKNIKQFTIRLCGINIYWAEKNSKEKLQQKLLEKCENRINELENN